MRKNIKINIIKFVLSSIILILIINICIINTKGAATFNLLHKDITDLGYGVTLEHIVGTSTSTFNSETTRSDRYQSIYTAKIDKNSLNTKVVQWSYFTGKAENGFGISTLERIAANYESTHPGEKVIVATNNWLSDTLSYIGELDGPQISDGLNFRVSDAQGSSEHPVFSHDYIPRPNFLGFDKEGKTAYFSDDFQNGDNYTETMFLSFYNGHNNVLTPLNLEVKYLNEEPIDGEIGIFFSNYSKNIMSFENAKIYQFQGLITRHDDHDTGEIERSAFAKGLFKKQVDKLDFDYNNPDVGYYTYYIVSKNKDFDALDLQDKILICQHELLNEFRNVVGGTTYYYHIVRNGEVYNNNYYSTEPDVNEWSKGHQINNEVHPRTAFIINQDGSFSLSVIDGRTKKIKGYEQYLAQGMDYQDMAWFYKSVYNAKEVFNYDGGGSSCMIVRFGDNFEIVNSPTDGHERGVANATLIVVEDEGYDVTKEITSNSITLNISNVKEELKDLTFTLNGITKQVENGKVVFDNLTKSTSYAITTSYKINNTKYNGETYNLKTIKEYPSIIDFTYKSEKQNEIKCYLTISDPDNVFIDGDISLIDSENHLQGYQITQNNEELEFTFNNLISSTNYEIKVNLYSKNEENNQHKEVITLNALTKAAKYPDYIDIDIDKYVISIGETAKIKITTTPENTDTLYTYTSSDDNIISISETGKITALNNGKVTITVTSKEGKTASCLFTVSEKENNKTGCQSSSIIILLISSMTLISIIRILKSKDL